MNKSVLIAKELMRRPGVVRALDWFTAASLRVASPPFRLFTRLGPASLPRSRDYLRSTGVFPIGDHYYQPLFNDAHLSRPLSHVRTLPGIDWRHDEQVALLGQLRFADELRAMNLDQSARTDLDFSLENIMFKSGDAEFLYSMIRHLKPARVIEIGSGHSTKIARLALERNAAESGRICDHVCIEPYEVPWLEQLGVRVIRQRAEDVGTELFHDLQADDLLFIDSSHMIRPQGDVLFEYLELLPSLASGVYVHIHDIFSPRDYLDDWIRNHVLMWNEQYLLEALLSNSERYEVVAALNYLHHSEYELLAEVCPYLSADREPGSLYLRVR